MPSRLRRRSGVIALTVIVGLVGCGGGGGGGGASSDASAGQAASGALTVSVSTATRSAVTAVSGVHYVDSRSDVTLTCSMACTVAGQSGSDVAATNVTTRIDGWAATLAFTRADGVMDITLAARDGSSVLVRLRPLVGAGGGATWTLGDYTWARGDSTQTRSTSTAGPSTGIAVNSTEVTDCSRSPYACSTVSVHWYGHAQGTFTIDPDFLTRQQYGPGTAWVNVKATGGSAATVIPDCTPVVALPSPEPYYNTDYRPRSGTLRIAQGPDGLFRVTTDAPLTVYKQPDSENRNLCIRSVAAPDAPASLTLQLNEVF